MQARTTSTSDYLTETPGLSRAPWWWHIVRSWHLRMWLTTWRWS